MIYDTWWPCDASSLWPLLVSIILHFTHINKTTPARTVILSKVIMSLSFLRLIKSDIVRACQIHSAISNQPPQLSEIKNWANNHQLAMIVAVAGRPSNDVRYMWYIYILLGWWLRPPSYYYTTHDTWHGWAGMHGGWSLNMHAQNLDPVVAILIGQVRNGWQSAYVRAPGSC